MDLVTTFLPFLCGSLAATMIFSVFIWRQAILDDRLIKHIRSTSYRRGWQDGRDSQFKGE